MEKLYPVVKLAKTCMGYTLAPEDRFVRLYYCPVCDKRISFRDVCPNDYRATARCRKGEPFHCKHCGSLIYPFDK